MIIWHAITIIVWKVNVLVQHCHVGSSRFDYYGIVEFVHRNRSCNFAASTFFSWIMTLPVYVA